jgi:hypothetical protein
MRNRTLNRRRSLAPSSLKIAPSVKARFAARKAVAAKPSVQAALLQAAAALREAAKAARPVQHTRSAGTSSLPSTKDLCRIKLTNGKFVTEEQAKEVQKMIRRADDDDNETTLEAIANYLGNNYGVEGAAFNMHDGVSWINIGATYDTTLCVIRFGRNSIEWCVSSWGDVYEEYEVDNNEDDFDDNAEYDDDY